MISQHKNKIKQYHNYTDIMHLIDQLNPLKPKTWQFCCNGFTAKKLLQNCSEDIKQQYAGYLVVIAALYQSKELLDMLNLDIHSFNVSSLSSNPLTYCIMHNYLQALRFLLQHGANPNSCDKAGNRPLVMATFLWNGPIILELLKAGADPKLTSLFRASQDLDQAYVTKEYNAIQMVMDRVGDMLKDKFNDQNHERIFQESCFLLDILLQYGADPYTQNSKTGKPFIVEISEFIAQGTPFMDELTAKAENNQAIEVPEEDFVAVQAMMVFVQLDKIFSKYAAKV